MLCPSSLTSAHKNKLIFTETGFMNNKNISNQPSPKNVLDILLKQIIDASEDSIFSVDVEYCYTSFNRKHFNIMKQLYGVEIEVGKCLLEYQTVEEDRIKAKHNIDKALMGEHVFDERCQGEEGKSCLYFSLQLNPLRDDSGRIVGVIIYSRDVTELKRTHEELVETKEKFQHVFEYSPNGISLTKPDGTLELNKAFCSLLGYSPEELKSKKMQEITHPDDVQQSLDVIQSFIKGESSATRFEKRYIHRDGSVVWVDINTTLHQHKEGMPLFFITNINNITQHKLTQMALEKSEARFRQTLDSMLEGCMIIGFDWKYLYVNEGAAKHGNKQREELLGHSILEEYPGVEHTEIFARYNECMTKRTPQQFESSFTFSDGKLSWFELRVQPIPEGIFVFSIDITERKHAENEIRKMNRVYAVITQINQMIIRAKDRHQLFEEACRIAVIYGNFRMAWVGLISNDDQTIKPVTWFGIEEGYLTKIKTITLSDTPEGHGPTATAIREGKYSFCNDIANDPRMVPWRDEALKRGYHSSIALPIITYGKPIGVFTIYTGESLFFNDDEIRLLEEVTGDITYALEKLYTEKERERVEMALLESETRFRSISESSLAGIYIIKDRKLAYVNPAFAKIFGYTIDELIGSDFLHCIHPDDRELAAENHRRGILGEINILFSQYRGICKNDQTIFIEVMGTRVVLDGNIAIIGNAMDITERKAAEKKNRENEERIQSLLDTMTEGVALNEIVFNNDGEMIDYRILSVNKAFYATADYNGTEVIGHLATELYGMSEETIKSFWENHRATTSTVITEMWSNLRNRCYYISTSPFVDNKFVTTFLDITERKQTEEQQRKDNLRTKLQLELYENAIQFTDKELYDFVLDKAVELTDSSIGFFHKVEDDQITITLTTWNAEALKNCTANYETHYPINLAGNWVDCVHFKKPVIYNDFKNSPNQKGLPEGHAPLTRFMSIPVLEDDKVRIIFGVGNKLAEYTEHDSVQIQLVANELQKIMTRRSMERSLKENETKFRAIFEHSMDAIGVLKDGVHLFVNSAYRDLFGYTDSGELVGTLIIDHIAPCQRETILERRRRREFGENVPSDYETRGLRKDGIEFDVEVHISTYQLSGERFTLLILRDITERKRAEELLSRERNRLRILVDTLPDRIYVKDAECRFVLNNLAHQHALKIQNADEIKGKTDFDFRPALLAEQYHDDDMAVLKSGLPLINREEPTELLSGEQGWLLTTKVPIKDENGVIVGLLGISRDITDRKRIEKEYHELEQTLIQTQKLESIGTLAGGIAHDFNNILSIILGHSSLLKFVNRSPEALNESLDVIENAVKRGSELVKQILTFARKSETVLGPLSVNTLIKEHVKMLNETFPKVIPISLELEKTAPMIIADPTKVYQVLMNLCVNARDAMPDGGKLTIKTEIINKASIIKRFSGVSAEQYLCLSISDMGIGIDEVTLKRIFDPFFTTKEKGKGTGLGLAVVYGIMKSHDGYIDVKSQPGTGTTFYLYFPIPIAEMNTKTLLHDLDEKIPGGTETILLVEDEVGLREMMKTFLEMNGYKVISAIDGEDALLKYSEHKNKIDIIFSDMGLPKITGQQMFYILKEHHNNIKCIFASGFIEPNVKTELLKSGVNDILLKPYTTIDLLKSLRKALDQ